MTSDGGTPPNEDGSVGRALTTTRGRTNAGGEPPSLSHRGLPPNRGGAHHDGCARGHAIRSFSVRGAVIAYVAAALTQLAIVLVGEVRSHEIPLTLAVKNTSPRSSFSAVLRSVDN